MDVFLAAEKVGENGKVVGIDGSPVSRPFALFFKACLHKH